jgi:hypothetical protein
MWIFMKRFDTDASESCYTAGLASLTAHKGTSIEVDLRNDMNQLKGRTTRLEVV